MTSDLHTGGTSSAGLTDARDAATAPGEQPAQAPADSRYMAAARRVQQRMGFAAHGLAFAAVNVGLFAQSGFDPGAGHFWGWGIGVAAHALVVLGPGASLKQRLIERELERGGQP